MPIRPVPKTKRETKLFFIVLKNSEVIYRCDTLAEGLAFIAGEPAGVLCQVLCFGRHSDEEQAKPILQFPAKKVTRKNQKPIRKSA